MSKELDNIKKREHPNLVRSFIAIKCPVHGDDMFRSSTNKETKFLQVPYDGNRIIVTHYTVVTFKGECGCIHKALFPKLTRDVTITESVRHE